MASVARMRDDQTVTFYLHSKLRKQAEAGNHNFISKISDVVHNADLHIAFDDDDTAARLRAMARPGYGLFLMQEPVNDRCLTFRKTYIYPFWRIEKQGKRWEWPVAKATFDPTEQNLRKSANFQRFWRNRLFRGPVNTHEGGFIHVPLQGRLLTHRSFQICSPIKMIETVLRCDPTRRVIATLHPSETYSATEQQALQDLLDQHPRLRLESSGSEYLLAHCDYIVTQNSSVGFMGFFLDKPLILFGKTDFHHIALSVETVGAQRAFDMIADHQPDYAAYLFWFLQMQAINAGRPEATDRIATTLRSHGWPI
ncbi:capsular polysaccharide export protein, LipB/KpsS family [Yoonia sp. 2307UL14-13]|uniref:capsular polysaccharide export protein, LipB/KpsS family n=1 Tax=Yoonia sp. 2307UL14-13 TaxID=3126506 RepID=UPI0030EBCB4A